MANKIYLIVDDDPDDQNFLLEALKEIDPSCHCVFASNGQEALTYLLDGTVPAPDVIFLDLNMPLLNGKQCLTLLKLTPSLQHLPVIIYSTTSNNKEIGELLTNGALHFLPKTHSYKALLAELSNLSVIMVDAWKKSTKDHNY